MPGVHTAASGPLFRAASLSRSLGVQSPLTIRQPYERMVPGHGSSLNHADPPLRHHKQTTRASSHPRRFYLSDRLVTS